MSDLWPAIIAAAAGLLGALIAYLANRGAVRSQRETARDELKASSADLEREFERRLAQVKVEHANDLARVLSESRFEYELELLRRRLDTYQDLMSVLKPLSMDGRPPPDQQGTEALVAALTDWYTDRGGLLMSVESRDSLFELRRELRGLLPELDETVGLKAAYPPRGAASRLRTQLTKDVLTRRQPFSESAG